VLLVIPVFLPIFLLGDAMYGGFPYLILAIVVLFFSLGPKDIGEEVEEYCTALEAEDDERIAITAKALIEHDMPVEAVERTRQVEEAVCVQANNRLFAVIFWFVLLGPFGAWTFRVTDLIRRRAVFKATRDDSGETATAVRDAAINLQSEQSEKLLARVGTAALSIQDIEDETDVQRGMRGARAANGMVFRLLFIWAAVIAAMTLYGWSV
jgi:membrane protein required for beta-lactamase induction